MIHDIKTSKLALAGLAWLLVAVTWGATVTMLFSRHVPGDKVASLKTSPNGLRVWLPDNSETAAGNTNSFVHSQNKAVVNRGEGKNGI